MLNKYQLCTQSLYLGTRQGLAPETQLPHKPTPNTVTTQDHSTIQRNKTLGKKSSQSQTASKTPFLSRTRIPENKFIIRTAHLKNFFRIAHLKNYFLNAPTGGQRLR